MTYAVEVMNTQVPGDRGDGRFQKLVDILLDILRRIVDQVGEKVVGGVGCF